MSSDYERFRQAFLRQFPEARHAVVYDGWPLGYLPVDRATGIAASVEVQDPDHGPVPATWTSGRRYLLGQDLRSGRWARYLDSGHVALQPRLEAFLVVSRAPFGADAPEPPVAAWVLGADGIGVVLQDAPAGAVASGRWLLLDGYVYDVRQAEEGPAAGRWMVNETRPPDPDIDHPPR